MKRSFWQRLDTFARNLTPFAIAILLVIVSALPSHVPGLGRVAPLLPLIAIFHWSVYRPHLMPAYAVFLVGLFQDGLSGAPFGLHAVVFLLAHGAVLLQQTFFAGKSFSVVWLGFSAIALLSQAVAWVLLSAYHIAWVTAEPLAHQLLLTLGVFPVVAWALQRWQRAFLKLE